MTSIRKLLVVLLTVSPYLKFEIWYCLIRYGLSNGARIVAL